jgi:hypothetical protein
MKSCQNAGMGWRVLCRADARRAMSGEGRLTRKVNFVTHIHRLNQNSSNNAVRGRVGAAASVLVNGYSGYFLGGGGSEEGGECE